MTSPDTNEPTPPATPQGEAAPTADAPEPKPAAEQAGGGGAGEGAAASGNHASDAAADASAGDDHDEGGDDHEHEGEAAEGAAGATPGPEGAKKKRRRRRRKKPGAGAAPGAEGAEGAATEGAPPAEGAEGAAASAPKPKTQDSKPKEKKKGPRPEPRERPAFNVGDVVFGKILEVTEDAILVDLSGKAKAIFDKLELLLPEDVADAVEEDSRRAEAAAEAILIGKDPTEAADAASAKAAAEKATKDAPPAAAAQAEEQPSPEAPPADDAAEAARVAEESVEPAESEAATQTTPARRIVTPRVEETPAEATAAASPEGPTDAEAAGEPEAPTNDQEPTTNNHVVQLPRVVLEAGAPFVGVVHNDGGRGGLVVLTHHPKRASKAKPSVAQAFKDHSEIYGLVTGVIKGGVEVDVDGLRAFAPGSHMDLRLGADLHRLVGKRLAFHVTQYAKRGRDVVLSRKAMLEVEAKAHRAEALAKLKPGEVVEGVVRSVVAFGAFIDVGGVEGLVPLAEMSHNRGDRPSDVFKVGEKVEVKVLNIDDKGKVWLSRRATIPDPWAEVTKKYAVGTKHKGKVVRLQPFGAFVELEPAIDGLIHAADLSIKRIEHPSEVVKIGDEIDVVVASIDPGSHKIALHPAPTGDAANETPQRVQIHKVVKVQVVSIESGGLIVRVLGATGRHARGFIPAGGTGTPRGTELRKIFPVGKELDAKVIEMDPRRGEVKLSIKAMQEESERSAYQQYRQQVKREAKFGTFADLLAKKGPTQK